MMATVKPMNGREAVAKRRELLKLIAEQRAELDRLMTDLERLDDYIARMVERGRPD